MDLNLWKDLAKKLAERICPFVEFKSGGKIEVKFLAELIEKEIEKFADERIVMIYQKVELNEDSSKVSKDKKRKY